MNSLVPMMVVAAVTASAHGQCLYPPANFYAHESFNCEPIVIGWDIVDGADGYRVDREPVGDPGHRESIGYFNVWPIQDSSASPGVQYNYYVIAQGACGESDPAGPVTSGRYLPPSPAWVSASDNQYCDMISVDWDWTVWAPTFEIFRGTSEVFEEAIYVGSAGSPPYEDYGVAGNIGYTYWVVTGQSCGNGAPAGSDIGYANYGMEITQNPESVNVAVGGAASLSVQIRGFASFEWYRDGELVMDNERISGANESTLRINPAIGADTGEYYCVAYGGCGNRQSQSATLIVWQFCPADFNHDQFVDFFDYDDYVGAFESGDTRADFNFDGFVDFFDYDDYVGAFESGC